jgi:hypothetical protein
VQLGSVNLALLALYFVPAWGRDGLRALLSPYHGLENPSHAATAIYVRELFDFGPGGLVLTLHVAAGIKLVIAAAFVSYLIEFSRACATGRKLDRETTDVLLVLAVAGIALCALPALALGEVASVRLYMAQMLLVAGAITVIVIERHLADHRLPGLDNAGCEVGGDAAAVLSQSSDVVTRRATGHG